MADLFISYSREDKARAEQVARGMQAAGFDVFWDTEVPPGQTWADYIEGKLSDCAAVLVLWSQESTKSQWVREEARMGRERGKLIPAMLDASQPPFGFGEVQAANLSNWQGQADHPDWRRLVGAVREAVNRARQGAAAAPQPPFMQAPFSTPRPAPPQPAMSGTARKGVHPLLIIGGLIVAVVMVSFVAQAAFNGRGVQPVNQPQMQATSDYSPPAQQQQTSTVSNAHAGLQARLAQMHQAMTAQGFAPAASPYSGSLAEDGRQSFPITLQSAGEYRLTGACDGDCGDLDLYVKAQDGTIVAQDNASDPTPIVPLQQAQPATGYVEVVMYNCTRAPCFYSVMLYGRPAGAQ